MKQNPKRRKSSTSKPNENFHSSISHLPRSEPVPAVNTSNGNGAADLETKLTQNALDRIANITKESPYDAEAKAAKQRELIPYETRIKEFRDMLAEKQVSAFNTWEQELNKISSDPRYLLLTAKERKQEFDRYTHGKCRHVFKL
jgi:transcription elongation regulator 1